VRVTKSNAQEEVTTELEAVVLEPGPDEVVPGVEPEVEEGEPEVEEGFEVVLL